MGEDLKWKVVRRKIEKERRRKKVEVKRRRGMKMKWENERRSWKV